MAHRTYTDLHGAVRCTECLRPAFEIPPGQEELYLAAKRVLTYLDAFAKGTHHSANEDLFAGRLLAAAIAAVEAEAVPKGAT